MPSVTEIGGDVAAFGGNFSNCGIVIFKHAQGCTREVQISNLGLKAVGSSRVGNRTDMTGIASPRANNSVSHVPQNERMVLPPLAAVTMYVLGTPVTRVEAMGDDETGSKWGAARNLTVFAVAVEHCNWCGSTRVPDGAARASA